MDSIEVLLYLLNPNLFHQKRYLPGIPRLIPVFWCAALGARAGGAD